MTSHDEYLNEIEQQTGNVFCDTCTFFQQRKYQGDIINLCWHPNALYTLKTFQGIEQHRAPADHQNNANDCEDFRPCDPLWRDAKRDPRLRLGVVTILAWLLWYLVL